MPKSKLQAVARLVSEVGSPSVVATLFLAGLPLLHAGVSWTHAFLAATFVTVVPTLTLVIMRRRGLVSDRHVTRRSQRLPIMVVAGVSIGVAFAVLALVDADPVLFQEVAGILLGLVVCMAITMVWKISIHSAVGTYVALAATAPLAIGGPALAIGFSALTGWSRVTLKHHTPSQVLAGQTVGIAVYLVRTLVLLAV